MAGDIEGEVIPGILTLRNFLKVQLGQNHVLRELAGEGGVLRYCESFVQTKQNRPGANSGPVCSFMY